MSRLTFNILVIITAVLLVLCIMLMEHLSYGAPQRDTVCENPSIRFQTDDEAEVPAAIIESWETDPETDRLIAIAHRLCQEAVSPQHCAAHLTVFGSVKDGILTIVHVSKQCQLPTTRVEQLPPSILKSEPM